MQRIVSVSPSLVTVIIAVPWLLYAPNLRGRRFDHVRSLAGVCVMAQCLQQSPTRTSSPLPLQPSSSPLNSAFLRARQNIHRQFHEHKIDLYCCGMMVINQSLEPGPGHSRLNVPTSSGRETPPQYQRPVFIPLQLFGAWIPVAALLCEAGFC